MDTNTVCHSPLRKVAALQCLFDDATTLALLALTCQHQPQQPQLKAAKRRNDGRLRKTRIADIDRHRSLSNRQKLQLLPDAVFGGTVRMEWPKFEQLLAKFESVLHAQRDPASVNYRESTNFITGTWIPTSLWLLHCAGLVELGNGT